MANSRRGKFKDNEYWADYMRSYRQRRPGMFKDIELKKKFGKDFGIIQFNELSLKQNHVCAICHKPEITLNFNSKQIQSLSVDHSHSTGKIRGLLCSKCNCGIGNLGEDLAILTNAIKYLTNQ